MKQDRFLTGILIGIAVLAVLALAMFFVRQGQVSYQNEDTPEAVLHNYVVALQKRDYERAYESLADAENKPDFTTFRQAFLTGQVNADESSLEIGAAEVDGDEAFVPVTVIRMNGGPLADTYRDSQTATLVNQQGLWKIQFMPYPYFNWDWYQPFPSKEAP